MMDEQDEILDGENETDEEDTESEDDQEADDSDLM